MQSWFNNSQVNYASTLNKKFRKKPLFHKERCGRGTLQGWRLEDDFSFGRAVTKEAARDTCIDQVPISPQMMKMNTASGANFHQRNILRTVISRTGHGRFLQRSASCHAEQYPKHDAKHRGKEYLKIRRQKKGDGVGRNPEKYQCFFEYEAPHD